MKIKIKRLNKEAKLPNYEHAGDAGMDIYSIEDKIIERGKIKLISTGLAFEIPEDYELQVRPKSGLALKHGITVLNTPGTLDSGYRGELKIILFNAGEERYEIKKWEKICQAVINKIERAEIQEVEELSESERGEGGFGSTGK